MRDLKIRFQIHDMLFYLLLVFSFYFTRNMICRVMMVLFFGYTILRQLINRQKAKSSFYFAGFLIFILYGAANIFLDNVINVQVARTMVVSLVLNLMMIYAIVQYVYMQNDVPKVIRTTELGIFTTAFVVVLLSLGTITSGRLGGGTEINANILAMLCVYGFILCMYLRKIGRITPLSCWVRMGFYALAVLLTGSRKGLVMIVLATVVVTLIFGKKKLVRNLLIGIASAVVVYLVIMNVEFLYNIIGVRIENLLLYLTEGTTTDGSLASRLELIEIAKPYIERKPWTGYGYDCFKMISGISGGGNITIDGVGYYSHNNYIELLFSGGIIGLVLYYIPVLYLLIKLLRGIKTDTCIPYMLALFVSKLAIEYAYVSYYDRIDAYIVAVILGSVLVCSKKPAILFQRQWRNIGRERKCN